MRHTKQSTTELSDGYKLKDYIVEEFSQLYRLSIIFDQNQDVHSVAMKKIDQA